MCHSIGTNHCYIVELTQILDKMIQRDSSRLSVQHIKVLHHVNTKKSI